jgi:hypothetical protein
MSTLDEWIGELQGRIVLWRSVSEIDVADVAEHLEESETTLRWLIELRARRLAMGRDPDDERNAVADLACPACGDIMGECGCAVAAAVTEEALGFPGPGELPTIEEGDCGGDLDDCPFAGDCVECEAQS